MSQTVIECKNVSLGYEGKVILENVNFSLKSGDYLYIIGENGTGKSTLIKALLKLKKTMAGSISFGDELKAKEIGYLPQQTQAQKDFPASVYEVVLSGRLNSLGKRPFYSRADKKDALDKIELMGLSAFKNTCYHDLSGGQKQRVLLARAMCATKKLILLDEPVAGLDPKVTKEMYELIAKINRELSITVIMVSHDMEATCKYASHILWLSHEENFFGTRDEFLETKEGMKYAGMREVSENV